MIDRIADIIELEVERAPAKGERTSEALRWAAWLVREEFPSATVADFKAGGAQLGFHVGSLGNRWNEAMKNWDLAFG